MSMNLAFEDRKHNIIDFPYQTTSETSKTVLSCKTTTEQMMVILADIKRYGGDTKWDQEWRDESMLMIETYLNDPHFRLVMV